MITKRKLKKMYTELSVRYLTLKQENKALSQELDEVKSQLEDCEIEYSRQQYTQEHLNDSKDWDE